MENLERLGPHPAAGEVEKLLRVMPQHVLSLTTGSSELSGHHVVCP